VEVEGPICHVIYIKFYPFIKPHGGRERGDTGIIGALSISHMGVEREGHTCMTLINPKGVSRKDTGMEVEGAICMTCDQCRGISIY
jgi:hypothetical protein